MAAINYAVKDNWGSGFVGSMTLASGTSALDGWTVEFDAAFAITNIWGAEIISHVGNHYVIRNAAWNGTVAAGGNATFGFQATPGPSGETAAGGLLVNGGGGEPPPVALPTLSVADASVAEGNGGETTSLGFTVNLSQASATPVTVSYATANATATSGQDYVAQTGTLTFAAGETSKTIQVAVVGDGAVEANETMTLALSNASGATIADGSATGSIVNDDVAPPPPPPTGGGANVDYTLSSNWGSGFTATMAVEAGSTALGGWTVEFNASFTITNIWNAVIVNHVGDHYVVRNESYNGTVPAGGEVSFGFQATPGSTGTSATDFTLNGVAIGGPSEPPPVLPTLSVGDASVIEGNGSTTELAFAVTLSAPSASAVTVAYATGNGTASADSDYTAKSGTLTFAAGDTSRIVRVQVTGDTAVEASETLTLSLASPSGATIADGSGVGTIVNDDVAPLPTLSVADASVTEGNSGSKAMAFTVTLSAPAASAVTVAYATGNGTATAGSDYTATTGTLTFAAGETTKTVNVQVAGDNSVEASETLLLTLSSPVGATLADGSAVGTIVNDDQAAPSLPTLSVADTSVIEGDPGAAGGAPGWLSTSGNQIVDSAGHAVQIAGVNWFGFETALMVPHGIWGARGYQSMMDQMVELGFNTIRLPYSSDMLHSTSTSYNINYAQSPDLQGLTALQIMDKIVDYAGEIGLRIILDHHRSTPGDGPSANGLWYDGQHSEASWIADWQMLATRYADDPTVIGADLHNEPYNGTWGGGGPNDWASAAERAGNAIGEFNPNWLIFVEGVGSYQGQSYWWGGNLMGVRDRPVELAVDNKLVYSPHDYPNSVYEQPWFQGPDFPANLPAKFDQMWGYIFKEGIAPIYIGEFGTNLVDPKDAPWFEAITAYLGGDLDNNGTHDLAPGQKGPAWTFWSWNPNSGDTGGILAPDWQTPQQAKMAHLTPIQYQFHDDAPGDGDESPADQAFASFLVTLSEPATQSVTVDYHTEGGSAGAADFTGTSGSVTFAAGEQSKAISIAITPDLLDEANEQFSLVLTDASGATIARATASATILDDDTAVASPPPPPPPPPPPADDGELEAMFAVVNAWSGGFNGSVTLENDGASATSGWQVRIDMTHEITDIWNARIVSHDAGGYVVENAAWNGTIAPEGDTSFGFVASGPLNPQAVQVDLLV